MIRLPMRCVHMLTVSEWMENTDLKQVAMHGMRNQQSILQALVNFETPVPSLA